MSVEGAVESGNATGRGRVGDPDVDARRGLPLDAARVPDVFGGPLKGPAGVVIAVAVLLPFLVFAVPATADFHQGDDGSASLHAQCWSLGASVGRVEGLTGSLARLAGPDDGAVILEGTQHNYLTPFTSEGMQLSLMFVNDFNLVQAGYGLRWSTVPFPKAFLRPWVGAYLTLNFLEDQRNIDPQQENDESDGIGVGIAAAAGVTMRLSRSAAVEAAVRGDQIFSAGWLDTGEFFSEEFRIRGVYLRLLYFFEN